MRVPHLIIGIATTLVLGNAFAMERLNDSASPRQRVVASVEWLSPERSRHLGTEELNQMVATVRGLEVVLDTSRFLGREVEIFLRLPVRIRGLRSATGMRLDWRTQGKFNEGSVVPGDRELLFRGTIETPLLSDIFDFTVFIDSREVVRGLDFEPIYEINPL